MSFKIKILFHLVSLKLAKYLFRNQLTWLRNYRFKKLLRHLKSSPFYSAAANRNSSLSEFPLVNKKIFMNSFDAINTRGIPYKEASEAALRAEDSRDFSPTINGITIGLSSGTSGNRGIFLASETERAHWVAAILDRVIGFSLKKRRVAFFLRANSNLYSSVKSGLIQFHFFDLLDAPELNLLKLQKLQPHILVAQPSMLLQIAEAMKMGSLSIHPQKVISVAEVLSPEDNDYLRNVFGQVIHQVYQCTEGFLAASCKYGVLHFNEDFLVIEKKYIDDEKKRFHPVITDLLRTTQPVIRYELNDIIIEKKDCPCGSRMLGIERIEGRSDDILRFESENNKEASIFPDFFRRAIITADADVEDYTLVQKDKKQLLLYLKPADKNAYDVVISSITRLLKEYNVTGIQITPTNNKGHEPGNKLRRIKNETAQTN